MVGGGGPILPVCVDVLSALELVCDLFSWLFARDMLCTLGWLLAGVALFSADWGRESVRRELFSVVCGVGATEDM